MAVHKQAQDGSFGQGDSRFSHLNQLDGVHSELNRRLQQEVEDLVRRIAVLRENQSPGSESIIATYQRMIDNKRQFLSDLAI